MLAHTCMRACICIRTQMVPEQPRHSSAKLQPSEKLPARRQGPSTNPKVLLLGFQLHWVLYTDTPKSRAQVRFQSGGGKIQLSSLLLFSLPWWSCLSLRRRSRVSCFLRNIFLTTARTRTLPLHYNARIHETPMFSL